MVKSGIRHKLPALVIFDKDGTLIDFHSTWTPWVTGLATRLQQYCHFEVSNQLYSLLGYCVKSNTVANSSLLAYGSMLKIKHELRSLLLDNQIQEDHVDDIIDKCWSDSHVNNTCKPVPTTDLIKLFTWLKNRGVKLAVCTSDSRQSTETALGKLGIAQYFDATVCSDDVTMEAKPSPCGVLRICSELRVNVCDTAVIGDTTSDMLMGRAARVDLIIGVLSGIGHEEELSKDADVILDDVSDVMTLFNHRG